MNIKISKEENEYLLGRLKERFLIGSRLYGTHTEESDEDVLCLYDDSEMKAMSPYLCNFLPNYHQFQYDDLENNRQIIWSTLEQFFKNLISGDSTINADIAMFYPGVVDKPLQVLRTYKVIKAYIGFAKRDLKDVSKKNKLFHAHRSLYCAASLMINTLPTLDGIYRISKDTYSKDDLIDWEWDLRKEVNNMFDKNRLKMYYIPPMPKSLHSWNTLLNKLTESNNTKEFKYD